MTRFVYQNVIEVATYTAPPSDPTVHVSQVELDVAIKGNNFKPVSGVIGRFDFSIAGRVKQLKRTGNICNPGQRAILTLSPDYPYPLQPGQAVTLYEYGVKVMKGYVIAVHYLRPENVIEVDIEDEFTRAINYFSPEQEVTVGGHDTAYWVAWLCDRCGLSYEFKSAPKPVPEGVQIGLRPVNEALTDIIAFASWYMWVNPKGKLIFGPVDFSKSKHTLTDIIGIHHNLSTDQTRNVIRVYGTGGSAIGERVFASASTSVSGMLVDMVAAVGSSLIGTNTEAQRVADYMLGELGSLTKVIEADVQGDPTIAVGQNVSIQYSDPAYSGYGPIIALESTIDENGYIQNVTIGERCPRIAGYSTNPPAPLLAGTNNKGVYISHDKGLTWQDYNNGFPAETTRLVKRVAVNYFGEAMAIMNGRLYYNPSGTWTQETLPAPINTAGDVPAPTSPGSLIAVDATGAKGGFAVLTRSNIGSSYASMYGRTWVYERGIDTSGSSPTSGSWSSTEMSFQDPTSGSITYQVGGIDLSSQNGAIYVIASTGSFGDIPTGLVDSCLGGYFNYQPILTLTLIDFVTSFSFQWVYYDQWPILHFCDSDETDLKFTSTAPRPSMGNFRIESIDMDGAGVVVEAWVRITARPINLFEQDYGIVMDAGFGGTVSGDFISDDLLTVNIDETIRYDSYDADYHIRFGFSHSLVGKEFTGQITAIVSTSYDLLYIESQETKCQVVHPPDGDGLRGAQDNSFGAQVRAGIFHFIVFSFNGRFCG